MSQGPLLLQVNNLEITFRVGTRKLNVLRNVSFSIGKGDTVGLIGESGSGKSVTALSLIGLLSAPNVKGDILFNGENLSKFNERQWKKIRGNEISMIFQEPMTSLNPVFSIGEQLSEPLANHTKSGKSEIYQKIIAMLEAVGIPNPKSVFNEYPHQLSGGMRQRIMISLAMLGNPSLLIADEPTTALDVTVQAQILDLIKKLRDSSQMSVLLITHDFGVVAEMCNWVAVMYAGQIVEWADVRTLFNEPMHPYTEALLKSRPQIISEKKSLVTIPGTLPRPDELPEGCSFAPRCKRAFDRCLTERPPLYDLGKRSCRCWLYADGKGS